MSGSERFNTKKLTYDMEEPAFLRRLRQEQSGHRPQRDTTAAVRKKKLADDDEDAPAYIMEESGETISAREFKVLVASTGDTGHRSSGVEGFEIGNEDLSTKILEQCPADGRDNLLEAGTKSNKRKAMKIIGTGEGEVEGGIDEKEEQKDKKPRLQRKPKPKIKLSFQEDSQD